VLCFGGERERLVLADVVTLPEALEQVEAQLQQAKREAES